MGRIFAAIVVITGSYIAMDQYDRYMHRRAYNKAKNG